MTQRILFSLLLIVGLAGQALASGSGSPMDALFSADMAFKVANFILLLALLHIFLKKPLTNMLKAAATSSKDRMEASKKEVEAKQAELAEFNKSLVEMEKELASRQQKAIAAIQQEKERILADAKEQAAHIEAAAQKRIDQNLAKAKADIRAYMAEEASKLAEAQIQKDLDKTKQENLMKSYISTLEA